MQAFVPGQIIPMEGSGGSVRFQWNPKEIDGPNAQAEWDAIPTAGARIPGVEYSSGGVPHIRFDLALANPGADDGFVEGVVDSLRALTDPTVKGQGKDRPPRLKLILGTRRWTCILLEVSPHYHHWFHPITQKPYFARVGLLFWVIQ